jgi:hypothetical protein
MYEYSICLNLTQLSGFYTPAGGSDLGPARTAWYVLGRWTPNHSVSQRWPERLGLFSTCDGGSPKGEKLL